MPSRRVTSNDHAIKGIESKCMTFETGDLVSGYADEEDMVYSLWRHKAVHKRTGRGVTPPFEYQVQLAESLPGK